MTIAPYTATIIPFRARYGAALREANLAAVLEWWGEFESPMVVSDGRKDNELFNRSAAYNIGVEAADPDIEVFIFCESDMLVRAEQVYEAIEMATESVGMVVPFDAYYYHSPQNSICIRDGHKPELFKPMWRMDDCRSIGAVNVVSRKTMDAVGRWDDSFEGNWYDDDAMKLAFELLCAPTRFVQGPGHHLYHLPGHRGKHLTDKEKMATRANQRRAGLYEKAARDKNCAEMRRLLAGGK